MLFLKMFTSKSHIWYFCTLLCRPHNTQIFFAVLYLKVLRREDYYTEKKTYGKWFHSILCITTQYIHCGEEGGIQSQNKPRPLVVFNCYISSYHFTLSKHLHQYEICGFIYEVYANVSLINKGKKKKKLKNYGIQIKNVAWSL